MKRLINGQYTEITEEELEVIKQMASQTQVPVSDSERIAALEEALAMLLSGVTE